MNKKGYRVIPQMFDVRPVDETGQVNIEKFKQFNRVLNMAPSNPKVEKKFFVARDYALRPRMQKNAPLRSVRPLAPKPLAMKTPNVFSAKPKKINYTAPIRKLATPGPTLPKASSVEWEEPKIQLSPTIHLPENTLAIKSIEHFPINGVRQKDLVKPKVKSKETKIKHSFQPVYSRDAEPDKETFLKNALLQDNYLPLSPLVRQHLTQQKKALDRYQARKTKQAKEKEEALKTEFLAKEKPAMEISEPRQIATPKTVGQSMGLSTLFCLNHFKAALQKGNFIDKKIGLWRPALSFATVVLVVGIVFSCSVLISRGWQLKDQVIVNGQQAIGYLASAKDDLANQDFSQANQKFENAREEFSSAQKQLDSIGGDLLDICSGLPYLSKASSGKNVIEAGEKLTAAAQNFSQAVEIFSQLDNPLKSSSQLSDKSLLDVLAVVSGQIKDSHQLLTEANGSLGKIKVEDLPEQYQNKFLAVQKALPLIIKMTDSFEQNQQVLFELLGHNGPRKYLFVFQNNQEMRATGGFIGSYGIVDVSDGHIKNLMIDGIYNPDGQLRENVVPPKPIQKISAAWSTHDANWFPNFPTSAEKLAWFYEKTGGPTVDGVIAVTPTVLQKMLEITGPIEMPEYDTVVDKDNFVEKTQYEVEYDYDKEENKPKQFIADLAPKVMDKVFSVRSADQMSKLLKVLTSSLKEKQILIYAYDYNVQKIVSEQGWSGEVLPAPKDYLMVINSNINGFKTDGVIDETITHQAEIQADGSIIDTVKVRRTHNGGDTAYEWWNKVNADYMRLYVPKGSQLLKVNGQTREFSQPPLDYDQLGFKRDPQVEMEEQSMQMDEQSGTRIYEEENKTVFANWVYVSPKETAEIEYQYLLPFKVDWSKNSDKVDNYSLLVQKQSGSLGSKFQSQVNLPDSVKLVWRYPGSAENQDHQVNYSETLNQDRFVGLVLQEKQAK